MKRIMIIGSGGSGKSTFARVLGDKLNKKVYHLDALFWKPGWVGVPREEKCKTQLRITAEDEWIIDGNYGSTMDIRLNAADTVIFLDLPKLLCTYRVLKRMIVYRDKQRPDMGPGCRERLSLQFLKWVWQYPKNQRPDILEKLNRVSEGKKVIVLRSRHDVKEFLQQC